MINREPQIITETLLVKNTLATGFTFEWIDQLRAEHPLHSNFRFENAAGPFGNEMGNHKCFLRADRLEKPSEQAARIAAEEESERAAADRRARGVDMYWIITSRLENIHHAGDLKKESDRIEEDSRQTIGISPLYVNSTRVDQYRYDLTWFLPIQSAAIAFAMLVSGRVSEYEWPIKVSDLSEEEFTFALYDHVLTQH